jgi:hypothetical protein
MPCRCIRPRAFEGDDGRCHRCGYVVHAPRVTAATWQLALALVPHVFPERFGHLAQAHHPGETDPRPSRR